MIFRPEHAARSRALSRIKTSMALSALQFPDAGNRNPRRRGDCASLSARRTSHVAATADDGEGGEGLDSAVIGKKLETECAPGLIRMKQRIHAVQSCRAFEKRGPLQPFVSRFTTGNGARACIAKT